MQDVSARVRAEAPALARRVRSRQWNLPGLRNPVRLSMHLLTAYTGSSPLCQPSGWHGLLSTKFAKFSKWRGVLSRCARELRACTRHACHQHARRHPARQEPDVMHAVLAVYFGGRALILDNRRDLPATPPTATHANAGHARKTRRICDADHPTRSAHEVNSAMTETWPCPA